MCLVEAHLVMCHTHPYGRTFKNWENKNQQQHYYYSLFVIYKIVSALYLLNYYFSFIYFFHLFSIEYWISIQLFEMRSFLKSKRLCPFSVGLFERVWLFACYFLLLSRSNQTNVWIINHPIVFCFSFSVVVLVVVAQPNSCGNRCPHCQYLLPWKPPVAAEMTATKRPRRRWSASIQSTRATPKTGASSSHSSSSWSVLSAEGETEGAALNPALLEASLSPQPVRSVEQPEALHPAADRSWPLRVRLVEEWVSLHSPWARIDPTLAIDWADGKLCLRNANESATTHLSSACLASSLWSLRTNWPAPASTPK